MAGPIDLCPFCKRSIALVGRSHRCIAVDPSIDPVADRTLAPPVEEAKRRYRKRKPLPISAPINRKGAEPKRDRAKYMRKYRAQQRAAETGMRK